MIYNHKLLYIIYNNIHFKYKYIYIYNLMIIMLQKKNNNKLIKNTVTPLYIVDQHGSNDQLLSIYI